jgi:hypothetical protein
MKKFFIFSITSLIIVLIFFASYNLAFKENNSPVRDALSNISENGESKKKEATIALEKIHRLTQNPVMSPTIDESEGKLLYYDKKDSIFKMISFDKSLEKSLPDKDLPTSINQAYWSPDSQKVLLESNSEIFHYDRQERVVTKLKNNIDFAVWSNLNNKIIYKYFDPTGNKRSIDMATISGGEWQMISELDYRKVSIAPVPQTSLISFWNYPGALTESSLVIVNPGSQEKTTLFSGRKGADYLWSPDGNKLLSSFVSENSLMLVTSDREKEEVTDLKLPTMASKCVWAKNNKDIFCALPSDIPADSSMPDDYLNKNVLTKDSFWKVNTKNGKKKRIVDMEDITENIDASSLLLSPKEDVLFFINRHNGSLYRITL